MAFKARQFAFEVERRSGSGSEIEIFTPGELRALLAAAPPHVATCLAIQAFAGVRTAELLRLTWHDLERRAGNIEITAKQAKTAARRLIPDLAEPGGLASRCALVTGPNGCGPDPRTDTSKGRSWQPQGRVLHGKPTLCGTVIHFLPSGQTKDIAAVALEAGNSPK